MGRVEGKVAVVTGAASNPGIGWATAVTLAREGAALVVTDVDQNGVEACASAIREQGGRAQALRHDVTSESDWRAVIDSTVAAYGHLDVLVNNAGIAVLKTLEALTSADWKRQIDVNLTSVFLGCQAAMPELRATGGGSIINVSSVAGLVGIARCVAYGAAKGGVRIMSKSIALELAPYGIRCNTVHPGVIWTNMQAQATGASDASGVASDRTRIPLGRVGEAQDIANCVLYLASDESNYVTGAEFTVDAGMTCQ